MTKQIENNNEYLVCPSCSLHCDDLVFKKTDDKFKIINIENIKCKKKVEAYNISTKSKLTPSINNKKSTLTGAIEKIKKILASKNEIAILNHGTDMSGVRSILAFASQHHGIIDHVNTKYLYQNISIPQRTGYMATSLTEVKNRAELIIIFGNKIFDKNPRLIEKILLPKNSLITKKIKKEIILVGSFDKETIKAMNSKANVTNINIKLDHIPNLLQSIQNKNTTGISIVSNKILKKVQDLLSKTGYTAVTWTASDFEKSSNPEKIINIISSFVVDLNVNKRAGCFPISGALGDVTSSQVLTWLTGFPSRIKYLDGTFSHNKLAYNITDLIEKYNTDVVIHVSSLALNKIKINKKITNIVLGHPNSKFTSEPDVFIPIGVPGIDHSGIMFRTDNVVSVRLKKIRNINLPTTKNILDSLL